MKFLKFAFVMAFAVISLISCKKDDEPKSVAGTWEGKWGFLTETPTNFEKWDLEKGGDVTSYFSDGTVYAVGSWEKDGDEVEVNYTEMVDSYSYRFTGTYDEENDEITGNWYDVDAPVIGGTFVMERQ